MDQRSKHSESRRGNVDELDTPSVLEARVIKSASISHFKSLAEARLDFDQLNVIVGPNGVGKSNIVDALYFLHDCAVDDLDTAIIKRHGIQSIRQWSKTRPFKITIEITIENSDGNGSYRLSLSSATENYKVLEEYGEWTGESMFSIDKREDGGKQIYTTSFERNSSGEVRFKQTPRSDAASFDRPTQVSSSELFLTMLAGPAISMFSFFMLPIVEELKAFSSYAIYPNTLREPRVVSRQEVLSSDGANLASILKRLNSNYRKNKESIIEAIRTLMPSIVDITVRSAGGYYVPMIVVSEGAKSRHMFNMSQISDGTLRILGLLTAFYQPNAPHVIALEEPEQMIHPGALPIITEMIEDFISQDKVERQVFVTTHSPVFLDLVPPESIIWTEFSGGITTCGRINERQLSFIREQLFSAGELLQSEGFGIE